MRLGKIYGPERLESACARALRFRALSYRSVSSILKCGLDRQIEAKAETKKIDHPNIRGSVYFEKDPAC
jgi:hypothetical protein